MKVCLKLFRFRRKHVEGKYIDEDIYVVADDAVVAKLAIDEQAPTPPGWEFSEFAQLTGFERPPTRLIGTWPKTIYPDADDWAHLRQLILNKTSLRPEGLISLVKEWLGVKE